MDSYESKLSSDYVLQVETLKSNYNPYEKKQQNKINKESDSNQKRLYFQKFNVERFFLLLASLGLMSLYYSVIPVINSSPLMIKILISLALGCLCFLDYQSSIHKETQGQDDRKSELTQSLLTNKLSVHPYYLISIYSIICFISELLVITYIKQASDNNINIGIFLSVLSLELLFIKFYSIFQKNRGLEVINTIGIIFYLVLFMYIAFNEIGTSFMYLALFIVFLNFIKFYLKNIFQIKFNQMKAIWIQCLVEFFIGLAVLICFLSFFNDFNEKISFKDVFLVLVISLSYYMSLKLFFYKTKKENSFSSLIYPLILFFDLIINGNGFGFFHLLFIVSMSFCIILINSKILKENNANSRTKESYISLGEDHYLYSDNFIVI